jgi:hypothetical protein
MTLPGIPAIKIVPIRKLHHITEKENIDNKNNWRFGKIIFFIPIYIISCYSKPKTSRIK